MQFTTMPQAPPMSVARLIYADYQQRFGAVTPMYAVLTLANGDVAVPAATWRLLQLLQRSGSRFV